MTSQFVVQLRKVSEGKPMNFTTIRVDGPFDTSIEAHAYGVRESGKLKCFHTILPLSPPIKVDRQPFGEPQ